MTVEFATFEKVCKPYLREHLKCLLEGEYVCLVSLKTLLARQKLQWYIHRGALLRTAINKAKALQGICSSFQRFLLELKAAVSSTARYL